MSDNRQIKLTELGNYLEIASLKLKGPLTFVNIIVPVIEPYCASTKNVTVPVLGLRSKECTREHANRLPSC